MNLPPNAAQLPPVSEAQPAREVKSPRSSDPFTELVELASAQDYAPGRPAEGIVIRPVEEARSRILESGRLSAKVISERYALKYRE